MRGDVILSLDLQVHNKNGKLIRRRRQRCNSLLKAFAFVWHSVMRAAYLRDINDVVMRDTAGAYWTFFKGSTQYFGNAHAGGAPINVDAYGMTVGTGSTGVTLNDYMLSAKISHGSGSGQLQYQACAVDPVTIDGQKSEFIYRRAFINGSGSVINVREVGVVLAMYEIYSNQKNVLILRDVLGAAVPVNNGQTLTVRMKMSVTA